MHQKPINSGWIEVICGGMFSGKTEELLKISKTDTYQQYIAYHKGGENNKNTKRIRKLFFLQKKLKTKLINIENN